MKECKTWGKRGGVWVGETAGGGGGGVGESKSGEGGNTSLWMSRQKATLAWNADWGSSVE